MNKIYLILITSLIFSTKVSGQMESFVFWNKDGYSSDWIRFYENGRFELIHDEQCYAYTNGAGVFKVQGDSIQIAFFKPIRSESEVLRNENTDKKVDIIINVYSQQDSNILNTAIVFISDTTAEKNNRTEKVDSDGTLTFTLPNESSVNYLNVSAYNYVDCEIIFEEIYEKDYTIKIYLSEDPLQKKDFKGEIHKKEVIIRKGKNQIVYNGKTYKKIKNKNRL